MTFALGIHSRDTVWVVADRRLSYGGRREPRDDAVKIMALETTDGVGFLTYAGLGATPRGTQPSEWMAATLRGRGGHSFERTLGFLADAANQELPRHLRMIPGGAHFIVVPAFVNGVGSRLFSIDTILNPHGGGNWFRFTSHQHTVDPDSPSVRLAIAGSGAVHMHATKDGWMRGLRRLVKRNDRGQASDLQVADELARLNMVASDNTPDGTVGRRSIVVWRRRPGAAKNRPGGAHQFYDGVDREAGDSGKIPTIANGLDVQALVAPMLDLFMKRMSEDRQPGDLPDLSMDPEEINEHLRRLPDRPDDKLR